VKIIQLKIRSSKIFNNSGASKIIHQKGFETLEKMNIDDAKVLRAFGENLMGRKLSNFAVRFLSFFK
jgi:hypothetical protein